MVFHSLHHIKSTHQQQSISISSIPYIKYNMSALTNFFRLRATIASLSHKLPASSTLFSTKLAKPVRIPTDTHTEILYERKSMVEMAAEESASAVITDTNGFPVEYPLIMRESFYITDVNGFPEDAGVEPCTITVENMKSLDTVITDSNGFPVK